MKYTLAFIALLLTATTAQANEIEMTGYDFRKNGDNNGMIVVNIKNVSTKEVVGAKYTIVCYDVFDDQVVTLNVKHRSMNLAPGDSKQTGWVPNIFSDQSELIANNNAKNFLCELDIVQVILK
jgi:hypothetical protein